MIPEIQTALTEAVGDKVLLRNIVATLVLIFTVWGLRYLILRFVRQRLPPTDTLQLRWTAQVRGFSYAVLAFGLFTIWAAVNRLTRSGEVLGPDERVDVLTAVRGYTAGAARLNFEERDKGTIEAGKLADLVVLSDDPFAVDPSRLADIEVEQTIVGGRVEFEA